MVKVEMKWSALTGQEVQHLVDLMQGKEFTLTYREFGATKTADVYVAEINYDMKYDAGYASVGGICTGVAANAIEL